MEDFEIAFLDHLAIRVQDLEKSATWYQQVLGLKKYQFKEWGPFPIFMLAGKTGIALFPANKRDSDLENPIKKVIVDHFAFNVTADNFEKAKKKLQHLGISYQQQNHHFFESIYFNDPDGHQVEINHAFNSRGGILH